MKRIAVLLALILTLGACAAWFEKKDPDTVVSIDSWNQPAQATDWGLVTATLKWENTGEDLSEFWSDGEIIVTCADTSEYSIDFLLSGGRLDPGAFVTRSYSIDTFGKQAVTVALREAHVEEFGE